VEVSGLEHVAFGRCARAVHKPLGCARLAVFAALAGELRQGVALLPVDIVAAMICLTVLRLLGTGVPMACTVPLATAARLTSLGRSHRQEEEGL
jgi:CBS-domain-containing membrane protein